MIKRALPAILAIAAFFVLVVKVGTGSLLSPPVAPLQALTFDRVVLSPDRIEIQVRNTGPDAVDVSQVLVNEAYWQFEADPSRSLDRFAKASLRLDYPWIAGEPLALTLIDSTGATFSHDIEVASETPAVSGRTIAGYALLGTYAGVIPVMLGLLFLPALRRLGQRGLRFLLGLTAGMLAFLAVDGLHESLELAGDVAEPFQGTALVAGGLGLSLGALMLVGRRRASAPHSGLAVAYLIAIGIGLHNLGEGLAIGSAHAVGAVALGTFLVIGFAMHNLTEGVGIVAPTVRTPPSIAHLLALGAIAGLPTIVGAVVGGYAYSPAAATFLLAIGVGAIVQVVVELARLVRRDGSVLATPWVTGIAAGFVVMYGTGLAIKV